MILKKSIKKSKLNLLVILIKDSTYKSVIKRDKTLADKFMNISNDDTKNYPFCRLFLVAETFEHSTK